MRFSKPNRLLYLYINDLDTSQIQVDMLNASLANPETPKDTTIQDATEIIKEAISDSLKGDSFEKRIANYLDHNKLSRNLPDKIKNADQTRSEAYEEISKKLEILPFSEELKDKLKGIVLIFGSKSAIEDKLREELVLPKHGLTTDQIDNAISQVASDIETYVEANNKLNSLRQEIQNLINQQEGLSKIESYKRTQLLRIAQKAGIFIDITNRNVFPKKLDYTYLDSSGSEVKSQLEIRDLFTMATNTPVNFQEPFSNSFETYYKVFLNDPSSGSGKEVELSQMHLESILHGSSCLETAITSVDGFNKAVGWHQIGLNLEEKQQINYFDLSSKSIKSIKVESISQTGEVTLNSNIELHGITSNSLSLAQFAKWTNLHYATPDINVEKFNGSLGNLNQTTRRKYGDLPDNSDITPPLEPGQKLFSLLTTETIEIENISGSEITFKTLSGLSITEPLGQFLSYLNEISFINYPTSVTPEEEDTDKDTERDMDNETEDESDEDQPEKNKENQNKSNNSQNQNPKSDNSYLGDNAIWNFKLKPWQWTKKILTLNDNIRWFSYRDVETIIQESVNSFKSDLETKRKRALGKYAKELPGIGSTFRNMEKSARNEILDGHKEIISQYAPTKQIQVLFNADGVFEFVAAMKVLEGNGLIPFDDPRFIAQLNKYTPKHLRVNPTGENLQKQTTLSAVKTALDELLDPPAGTQLMQSNDSNYNNLSGQYKQEMVGVLQKNPDDVGMTLLHNTIVQFKNGKDVFSSQVEGYIKGVLAEGVSYLDVIPYIITCLRSKNSAGIYLLPPDFMGELKKEYPFFNYLLKQPISVLDHMMKTTCALDLSIKSSVQKDQRSPQGRYANYDAAREAVYLLVSARENAAKSSEYLDKAWNKDYAAANIAVVSVGTLTQELTPENRSPAPQEAFINRFQKQIPEFFNTHCSLVSDSSEKSFYDSTGDFLNFVDTSKTALANWYLFYSTSHAMTFKWNSNVRKLPSKQVREDLMEAANGRMIAFAKMALREYNPNISDDELYNYFYADYFASTVIDDRRNQYRNSFVKKNEQLITLFEQIPNNVFERVMKRAHKEGIFNSDSWRKYHEEPGRPIIGYTPPASNDSQK